MTRKNAPVASKGHTPAESEWNPLDLVQEAGERPSFYFKWGNPSEKTSSGAPAVPRKQKKKRRLIGSPNPAMERLHTLFKNELEKAIERMGRENTYTLRYLPSSTGCVPGSNQLKNIKRHEMGEYFYITDFQNAYQSVDLDRLTVLLVYIFKYAHWRADYSLRQLARNELAQFAIKDDPLFKGMRSFVNIAFAGLRVQGLAVGGPLSPYLLNLYCEVYLDSRLRDHFERKELRSHPEKSVVIGRFVDDLVISRGTLISSDARREIRMMINDAGFQVKHLKSKVLKRSMGTVFITGLGLRSPPREDDVEEDGVIMEEGILVFPRKKRRRIEGAMKSYLKPVPPRLGSGTSLPGYWNDSPEQVLGLAAEFVHYYSNVRTPNKSDERTMNLYKQFLEVAKPHLKKAFQAMNHRKLAKAT